ncbi:MAG: lytic murein transglycosylase [Candidatus Schmidhempelia sp.]|nr:lytic murein transglycosylase [Candidatus Schmidhempelia sp.]
MHRSLFKLLSLLVILMVVLSCSDKNKSDNIMGISALAETKKPQIPFFDLPRTVENFPAYVDALKQFARQNGISEKIIKIGFNHIYHLEHVITADKNQPEKKITLSQYLARITSDRRINLAKQKQTEFFKPLLYTQQLTGVPLEYIIALWGVESGYGAYQGKEDVISALATLAFEGRREAFFSRELIAALNVLQKGYITKDKFKGSWAGAMGHCQFMPSSLLNFGKDGDGDGLIDIWNNPNDVIASIANYLATVGWQPNGYWGNQVTLPEHFDLSMIGLDNNKAKTVGEWRQLGITFDDKKRHPNDSELAWVILPDDQNYTNGYIVYHNFKTLMHWNRSYFFAISIGTIADKLTEK